MQLSRSVTLCVFIFVCLGCVGVHCYVYLVHVVLTMFCVVVFTVPVRVCDFVYPCVRAWTCCVYLCGCVQGAFCAGHWWSPQNAARSQWDLCRWPCGTVAWSGRKEVWTSCLLSENKTRWRADYRHVVKMALTHIYGRWVIFLKLPYSITLKCYERV